MHVSHPRGISKRRSDGNYDNKPPNLTLPKNSATGSTLIRLWWCRRSWTQPDRLSILEGFYFPVYASTVERSEVPSDRGSDEITDTRVPLRKASRVSSPLGPRYQPPRPPLSLLLWRGPRALPVLRYDDETRERGGAARRVRVAGVDQRVPLGRGSQGGPFGKPRLQPRRASCVVAEHTLPLNH